MAFVVDASVTLAWCFEDEATPYTESVLDRLRHEEAVVPAIWPLEVANILLGAERRQRLAELQSVRFLRLLRSLSITVETAVLPGAWRGVLTLGRTHALAAYDASYLELAVRTSLPLATLDEALHAAATRLGLPLLQ